MPTNLALRIGLLGCCLVAGPLTADTFVVDSEDDAVDASPGDGSCATAAAVCTLRAAIQEANALAGADTISIPTGIFKLSIAGVGEDAAATGDLDVTDDLTITGAGEDNTFVDGTPADGGAVDRVFDVAPTAEEISVVVEHLTVQRGGGSLHGGGIRNQADLTVRDARLRWNSASAGGKGGGIYHAVSRFTGRDLTLLRARVEDNSANLGGGVHTDNGKVVVTDSSISWNNATAGGGGLFVAATSLTSAQAFVAGSTFNHNISSSGGGISLGSGSVSGSITNTTIFGNRASGSGGGLTSLGSFQLNNVTIAHNSAGTSGGGVHSTVSYTTTRNSIVADNMTDGGASPDCTRLASDGYNLVENTTGCIITGTTTGNVTGMDPNLAPLAFYGGPTRTAPPLPGSPAIEAGNPATPTGSGTTCAPADQAGAARPISTACDIGAWEADGSEAIPTPPPGFDIIVTSFDDYVGTNDTNIGDGQCLTPDGTCNLRAAIQEANALTFDRYIYLPAGVYDDRQSVTGDDASAFGDLDISGDVTILGEGPQNTIINGRNADRVFQVLSDGYLTLEQVMVRKGSSNEGGAIYNQGSLALQDVILRDNRGNKGSGIYAVGNVIINDSTIRDNRANADGGGLYESAVGGPTFNIFDSDFIDNVAAGGDGGALWLRFSHSLVGGGTIAGNSADEGGGIWYQGGGSLSVGNTTISGNRASGSIGGWGGGVRATDTIFMTNNTISGNHAATAGGGIYTFGPLSLTNVTVTDNTAPDTGGVGFFSTASVVNTIVAGNSGVQCSAGGTMTSNGSNISGDMTCGFTATSDQEGTDPLLGPLADNGGPAKTHIPLPGSPAIDRGNDTFAPPTDQRGVSRPQGSASDIGAVEVEAVPSADLAVTKSNGQSETVPGTTPSYAINVANGGPDDVTGAVVTDVLDAGLIDVASATWTCVPDGGAGTGTACPASGSAADLATGVSIDLEAGDAVTITLLAPVFAAASGSLSNTAEVAHPTIADPTPGNNLATDTDTLTPQADLSISKSDGTAGVIVGNVTTYTITASTAGPSDAPGATVTDTFPADLTSCTWTCSGSGGGVCAAAGSGDITESVDLPAGGEVIFSATCTVGGDGTATVSNTATVAAPAGVPDPVTGNNSATDENGGLGPCGFPNDPALANTTIDTSQDVTGCQTVTLGANLEIEAAVTVTAGSSVVFLDNVGVAGDLEVAIDADLASQ